MSNPHPKGGRKVWQARLRNPNDKPAPLTKTERQQINGLGERPSDMEDVGLTSRAFKSKNGCGGRDGWNEIS